MNKLIGKENSNDSAMKEQVPHLKEKIGGILFEFDLETKLERLFNTRPVRVLGLSKALTENLSP